MDIYYGQGKRLRDTVFGLLTFHFEKVKAAFGKKTVLSYPIPYAETFLSTDASDSCIAATLYQFDPSRKLRVPIAFFSRKLSKAQLKYAIFDKEVLAILRKY